MKKLTTEEFIRKSNEVHNYKYDYSSSKYLNGKDKMVITCKEHGDFLQRASAHLDGQGCMVCRLDNRRTGLNIFLQRCKDIHGDRYDYSLIGEYKNSREKVKVICKEHGVFEITPYHHVNRKQGCNDCRKLGLSKFIELSNIKHDYRYDYSLIKEYEDNKSKVKIICKEHGVFEQRVNDHKSKGIGCPECTMDRFRLSTKDFIIRSNIIHNNKYIYPKNINFKSNKEKVKIKCEYHDIFKQRVDSHLNGQGCPSCKDSKGELVVRNYLLDNNIEFESQKKFIDCVYQNELKFDFYLPEYNTCIEYNGKQHYIPINYFGGEKSFKYQLIRDKIKSEYCENNNIKLIIIKYDEDILEKLTNYFI
jgi:Zn finger protein HypA/HybF involved in hydrogenase expression